MSMSTHEQGKQKKQLKRRAREKEVRKSRNVAHNISLRDYVLQLARGAWDNCYEAGGQGMHQLICIRKTHAGYGASVFLLDEYCLGVKDAEIVQNIDLSFFEDSMRQRDGRLVTPAYALKKLKALIAWAREIGFEPHAKTHLAMEIFREIDSEACPNSFAFGRPEDGKPMFISGPFDGPDRIQAVLSKLQRLGKDNHHFAIAISDAYRHPLLAEHLQMEFDETGEESP
jgi:hypothetical protein